MEIIMEELEQVESDEFSDSDSESELLKLGADPMLTALNEMRLKNQLTDAVVSCRDGRFPVHRAVLSACSSYFRAQFTGFYFNNSVSAEPQQVFIHDMSSKVFKQLMNFAYLKRCNITEDNVFEMFVLADYLGITSLMPKCVKFIEDMISPVNCLSILQFSKFRSLDNLRTHARRYFLCNFPHVYRENPDIFDLDVEEFYEFMAADQLNTKDEDIVWFVVRRWIERDPEKRKRHIGKLLKAVRMSLMTPKIFLGELMQHPYVCECAETRPLILESFRFMFELDIMNVNIGQLVTSHCAIPRMPNEVIFAIGGWGGGASRTRIDTYDARADRWVNIDLEDPAGPRAYHGTTVIGTKIYIIGGYDGVEYFSTCRFFDAALKVWQEISPMHSRRCYVSCAELNGLIYAMGGNDGHTRMKSVERYDPKTNQWTVIAPMLVPRSDASACVLNGCIYVAGGFNGVACLDSVERYDPEISVWTRVTNMSCPRSGLACITYHGTIYAIGGYNGDTRLASGEQFDDETQTWYPISDMHHPRSNFGLAAIEDNIFAIGGFDGRQTISHVECYVVRTDEWMEVTSMLMVRSAMSANTISNLPNISDYIYDGRENLMEERRMRLFANIDFILPDQPAPPNEPIILEEEESTDGLNSSNDEEDINLGDIQD